MKKKKKDKKLDSSIKRYIEADKDIGDNTKESVSIVQKTLYFSIWFYDRAIFSPEMAAMGYFRWGVQVNIFFVCKFCNLSTKLYNSVATNTKVVH